MWMNSYLQDSLLRERMGEGERLAATHFLLRGTEPLRPKPSVWERVSRRLRPRAQSAPDGSFATVAATRTEAPLVFGVSKPPSS